MSDPNGFPGDSSYNMEGSKSGTASPQSHTSVDMKPALESLLAERSPEGGEASSSAPGAGSHGYNSPVFLGTSSDSQDKGSNPRGSSGSDGKDTPQSQSSQSEGAGKRKVKAEPESQPSFLGLDQSKDVDALSSQPPPAKVPSRGKSETSRPSLQDVITQLAHSAGGQSSVTTSVSSSPVSVLPVTVSPSPTTLKPVKGVSADVMTVKVEEPAAATVSSRNKGDKPAKSFSPLDVSLSQSSSVSPKTPSRGKGRERKPKGDHSSSPAAAAAHQGSLPLTSASPQTLAAVGLAGMSARMPLNGAIFPSMPLTYDGAFAYDYNLPDRGLGSAAMAGISPRFPAVAPGLVGYFPSLGVPVSPWNLTSTAAMPAVAMDTSGAGAPLDLSSSHKESGGDKVKSKPSSSSSSSSSSSAVKPAAPAAKPKQQSEEKVKEKGSGGGTEEAKGKPDPPVKKPKYEKHMLIFGEKEVEIICVEKNCWIVRNEQELFDIIRSTSPQPCSQPHRKSSHVTPCDSASGSDCECLRSAPRDGGRCAREQKGEQVKDDCACVTSSIKRSSVDPANVPSSSTQKNTVNSPGDDGAHGDRLKTMATSSTGSQEESGEESSEVPAPPSPKPATIGSSDSGVKVKRLLGEEGSAVTEACHEEESERQKCPVLQQMLKTSH